VNREPGDVRARLLAADGSAFFGAGADDVALIDGSGTRTIVEAPRPLVASRCDAVDVA